MREVEKFVRSLALLVSSIWIVINITSQTDFVARVIAFAMCVISAIAMFLNKKFTQMAAALTAIGIYLIGVLNGIQVIHLMMDSDWIWFPEVLLLAFNIFWNHEPKREREISMIASVWIIVSIQAIGNQTFFWEIMTPGPKGIVFCIFIGIIGIKAVSNKQKDIATAISAALVLLIYWGITWTSIPLSEVVSNNFLLMIPTVMVYIINGVLETK